MDDHVSVEEALSREVIRKLRLAAEAETKDDREIICEELFCDITGTVDQHAQERLGLSPSNSSADASSSCTVADSTGMQHNSTRNSGRTAASRGAKQDRPPPPAPSPTFYEVLARFYQHARDSGEAVSHLCQKLWGQGYAAPIFALLLHRWLLLGRETSLSGRRGTSSSRDSSNGGGSMAAAKGAPPSPFAGDGSAPADALSAAAAAARSFTDATGSAVKSALAGWRSLATQSSTLLSPLTKAGSGGSFSGPQQQAPQQQTPPPPQPQRIKQVSVLVLGARQLFQGDVHSGQDRFAALFRCLAEEVVLGPGMAQLSRLPLSSRSDLLAVVAAVLPYYSPPAQMQRLIACLPPPSAVAVLQPQPEQQQQLQQDGQQPDGQEGQQQQQQRPALVWSCAPGAGADFMLGEVADMLGKIRSEASLLQYLAALQVLKGSPHLRTLHHITSLRLQSELYSLTSPGGPHYAPRAVRVAAIDTLDALYPLGRRTRRVVGALFRLLHPTDWLGEFWLVPLQWWAWLYTRVLVSLFSLVYALLWRAPRPAASRRK